MPLAIIAGLSSPAVRFRPSRSLIAAHAARTARTAFAACAAGLAASAAHAAPLWELGAGVGGLALPHYRGSDQSHQWLLPVPYVAYRGPILRASRSGARALLVEGDAVEVDVSMTGGPPARSRDNRARASMPDLDPTVEFGPNLDVRLATGSGWTLSARAPVRAVIALGGSPRQIGWQAEPKLNLDWRAAGWAIGLQGGPLFGDRRLHRTFYEVAPVYATPVRPAYAARSGFAGWQATLGASRRVGDVWIGGYLRADALDGAVFDASPLVRRTSHLSGGIAVSWVFARSSQDVPERE